MKYEGDNQPALEKTGYTSVYHLGNSDGNALGGTGARAEQIKGMQGDAQALNVRELVELFRSGKAGKIEALQKFFDTANTGDDIRNSFNVKEMTPDQAMQAFSAAVGSDYGNGRVHKNVLDILNEKGVVDLARQAERDGKYNKGFTMLHYIAAHGSEETLNDYIGITSPDRFEEELATVVKKVEKDGTVKHQTPLDVVGTSNRDHNAGKVTVLRSKGAKTGEELMSVAVFETVEGVDLHAMQVSETARLEGSKDLFDRIGDAFKAGLDQARYGKDKENPQMKGAVEGAATAVSSLIGCVVGIGGKLKDLVSGHKAEQAQESQPIKE